MIKKVLLLILLVGIVLGILYWQKDKTAEPTRSLQARAAMVLNGAWVIRGKGVLPLKAGMVLEKGDEVKTEDASVVELFLSGGHRIWIKNKARLSLETLEQGLETSNETIRIGLEQGQAFFSIEQNASGKLKFEVRTPTAVVGVRGTLFVVRSDKGDTEVKVARGKVGLERNVPLPADVRQEGSLTLEAQEKASLSAADNEEYSRLYHTKRQELPRLTKEPVARDAELEWLLEQAPKNNQERKTLLIIEENPDGLIFLGEEELGEGNLEILLESGIYQLRIEGALGVYKKQIELGSESVRIQPVFAPRPKNTKKPEPKSLKPLAPQNKFKIQ